MEGFNNFRFLLFSWSNFAIGLFTTIFLAEPKLNPGALDLMWPGTDRPGVDPGLEKPRCFEWPPSSSEDETELLEWGLWNTLGFLLVASWFSVAFCLTDNGAALLFSYLISWDTFFNSTNACRPFLWALKDGEEAVRKKPFTKRNQSINQSIL